MHREGHLDTARLAAYTQMSVLCSYKHGVDFSQGMDAMVLELVGPHHRPVVPVAAVDPATNVMINQRQQLVGEFSVGKLPREITEVRQ